MYGKVIVPTDGSELSLKGVKEGLRAAKQYHIPALAVYVVTPDAMSGVAAHRYEDIGKQTIEILRDHRMKEGKKALDKVKKIAADLGVEIQTELKQGEPYEGIIELVNEDDLIYMSSHGRSGISSIFIGSTTDRVIKNTNATVAVVQVKNDNG